MPNNFFSNNELFKHDNSKGEYYIADATIHNAVVAKVIEELLVEIKSYIISKTWLIEQGIL